MTTISWNINGLITHFPELQLLTTKYQPEYICLQETHLQPEKQITLKNYDIYRRDRLHNGHGGVAILTHKNNHATKIQLHTTLEAIAVQIIYPEPCTLCSIYIPPDQNINYNLIDQLIQSLPSPYILTGDFNAHNPLWDKHATYTNQRGKIIEDILDTTILLNDGRPTHFSTQYGTFSAIDLTICDRNIASNLNWDIISSLNGSDHFPMLINNLLKINPPATLINKWKLNDANWELYTSEITKFTLNISRNSDVDDLIEQITDAINEVASLTIKRKKSPKKNKQVPWWNKECHEAIKKNNEALKKYKKNSITENLIELKKTKALKRRIIKQSKKSSWDNYISTITPNTTPKHIWEKIGKIRGKNSRRQTTTLLKDNKVVNNPQDIVNIIADTFEGHFSNTHYKQPFLTTKEIIEKKNKIIIKEDNKHQLNQSFKMWELNSIIKNLKNNKSPGPDQIHNEMIKYLPGKTRFQLLEIYNHIWKYKVFPDTWREVIIIPILKPNKSQMEPSNYRPIALSNTICKIMEKLVNNRLMWFLEKNNLISNIQCGFRNGRSTTDQLMILQSEIQNGFRNKQHLVAIFFDLEKAFDTTWRHNILKNLQEDNIQGNILHFINNFLSNRRFKVRSHDCYSSIKNQENGIPQGASLSTTLFIKAIDRIITNISFPNKALLFADDLVIFCRGKNIKSIENQLQTTISKIEQWAKNTGFNFSQNKTKAVHFCKLRGNHREPDLRLLNITIPIVNKTKFLGVILDKKLTWKQHILELKSNCFKRLNILKTLSSHEWGAHTESLLTIYRMLIRPILDYGCIVYNSALPRTLKLLDTIQHAALRLATGAFRTSPIKSLQNITNEKPLSYRRTQLTLNYAINLASSPKHPSFNYIFTNKNNILKFKQLSNPFNTNIHNAILNLNSTLPQATLGKSVSQIPPWEINEPICNLELAQYTKEETHPDVYKKNFIRIQHQYKHHREIYTDASKTNDLVGAAVVTEDTIYKYKLPSTTSIFTAEVYAISRSLQVIEDINTTNQKYVIYSDSLSAITSIRNIYPKLQIIQEIQNQLNKLKLENNIQITLTWVPAHIGILGNEKADIAAKDASINSPTQPVPIQTYDQIASYKQQINNQWQQLWKHEANNKLRQIKEDTARWNEHGSRKEQVIITRLRIGHTRLTHSHIFEHQEKTQCDTCNTNLTVNHILIDCRKYHNIRQKHQIPTTIHETLSNDPTRTKNLIKYLKETQILKQL